MVNLRANPGGILRGEATVPGDKSISHRAIILGAIAQGQTTIRGFLEGKDCLATLRAMQSLGVVFTQPEPEMVIVQGVGLKGLQPSTDTLDCENSGTTMRLLTGLLAAQPFKSTLKGDHSLQRRPMERILIPLKLMGADIHGQQCDGKTVAPLTISGAPLKGIHYALPMASAQVKSCLLLAGLYAKDDTVLIENVATRDHTERMLQAFGATLSLKHHSITLHPGKTLNGQEVTVPGDISSAAFFIAGASFTPNAHILLRNVGINPRRTGIISILRLMGADITILNQREWGGEPVGDIEVRGRSLKGITLPVEWVASAIDEFPVIFIAAAMAQGETIIRGIQELRFKETDRIAVMAKGLKTLGIPVVILPDGIMIRGAPVQGGVVHSEGDHRVAMAFAIAALMAKDTIIIQDAENIATSFPTFTDLANYFGLSIRPEGASDGA